MDENSNISLGSLPKGSGKPSKVREFWKDFERQPWYVRRKQSENVSLLLSIPHLKIISCIYNQIYAKDKYI